MGQLTPAADLAVDAPAKLNLRLKVVGVRADGYHLVDTDMVPVTLHDTVTLRARADGPVNCDYAGADIPAERDLCVRAAALLKRARAVAAGVDVHVEKRIPPGSGMGGGSSDAAAVLLGLNRVWDLGVPTDELAELAAGLGADVPFFLHGRPMRATGVGDELEPIDPGPGRYFIAVPEWGLDTGEVYRRHDNLIESPPAGRIAGLAEAMGPNDLTAAAADLSPPAFGAMVEVLLNRFGNACLTGSGSAVFSGLRGDWPAEELEAVARSLPRGTRWFAAESAVARDKATGE